LSKFVRAKVYLAGEAPLLKDFLEAALQAEMGEHLGKEQRLKGNQKMVMAPKN